MARDEKSETVRRALRWLIEERRANPGARLADLVTEAGLKFDLSPAEQDSLWRLFVKGVAPDEE